MTQFLDLYAEEASNDEEDEYDEDEEDRHVKKKQQESQYYSKDELWKHQRGLNLNLISNMEERYKDTV